MASELQLQKDFVSLCKAGKKQLLTEIPISRQQLFLPQEKIPLDKEKNGRRERQMDRFTY